MFLVVLLLYESEIDLSDNLHVQFHHSAITSVFFFRVQSEEGGEGLLLPTMVVGEGERASKGG